MNPLAVFLFILLCSCHESSRDRSLYVNEDSSEYLRDFQEYNDYEELINVSDGPSSISGENDYRGKLLLDSTQEYIGVDYNGVTRSCSPQLNLVCTQELLAEDRYGLECREDGIDIVYCGCHDPICIF